MEFLGIFLSRKRHGKKKKHSRSFVSAWFSVSGKRDSNPRPPAWKASALSTELFPRMWGEQDSNLRRRCQLSYSQPQLATLVSPLCSKNGCFC